MKTKLRTTPHSRRGRLRQGIVAMAATMLAFTLGSIRVDAQVQVWNVSMDGNRFNIPVMPIYLVEDTLYVAGGGAPRPIPLSQISRITIRDGNHFAAGAVIGLGIGVLFGEVTREAVVFDDLQDDFTLLSACTGAALGGLIGLLTPRTQTVDLEGMSLSIRIDAVGMLLHR